MEWAREFRSPTGWPVSDDLYSVLGVDQSATQSEIHDAYISRIRVAHPDTSTGDEELAKRLNTAYHILSDPQRRQEYDRAQQTLSCPVCGETLSDPSIAVSHFAAHFATSQRDACRICGRGPAHYFSFTGNAGFVIFRRKYGFDGNLCRACSKGLFREFQARNITRGPWGIFSFFASIASLVTNLQHFKSGQMGLDNPIPRDWSADEKLSGRPIFSRPSVYVSLGVILYLLISIVGDATTSPSASFVTPTTSHVTATTRRVTTPPATTSPALSWTVGQCVSYLGDLVSLTPCGASADGRILAIVRDLSRWRTAGMPVWALDLTEAAHQEVYLGGPPICLKSHSRADTPVVLVSRRQSARARFLTLRASIDCGGPTSESHASWNSKNRSDRSDRKKRKSPNTPSATTPIPASTPNVSNTQPMRDRATTASSTRIKQPFILHSLALLGELTKNPGQATGDDERGAVLTPATPGSSVAPVPDQILRVGSEAPSG
jgi:curved DNA-binding protein CbpA